MTAEGMARLRQANDNAAALWTALAQARGHGLVRRPGFLAVVGDDRSGLRVLLLAPQPQPEDLAELIALVRDRSGGPVIVEDPFSSVDGGELGLTPRQLPVMIRYPGPPLPPSGLEVTLVERVDQLETAEDIVVRAFPMENFQPYRPGEMFPRDVLERPEVDLFLIARDGVTAGACLTIVDETVGGIYWVTTLPEHRYKGVARALMHAVLAHLKDLPVTLTAATAGRPLYDSLGFGMVVPATWWV